MTFTKTKLSLALIASAIISAPFAMADDAAFNSGIKKALADSKVNISLRARYEGVDEDGVNGAADKDATALTVKSRITLQTGDYKNWSLGLEVDNVTALVDDYNDLTFDYSGSDAVVADPEITDVNQAFLQYNTGKVKLTAGRQRILHNNQRFIGGVGWRQNEQTYDGYRIEYVANDALSLDYSYIYNANRIFGDDKKGDDLSGAFHFANAAYKINSAHKISAFAYVLDFDIAHAMSSSTYGALYHGKFGAVTVNLSAATQSDAGDNAVSYDANYYNAEIATDLGDFTLLAGLEVLGSDEGKAAFSTPFATLHKFQGFSDKFLNTGSSTGMKNGVEDTYITVKTKLAGVKLAATFHDLASNEGTIDYGTELDLVAAYTFKKNYNLLVKFARYSADQLSTDTSKLWIQVATKF
ncbi:alginate export family protein [Colwellia hornerae]|uniref:Alginate export domain-containing protein n=1 Tax=Colwellia hornerae TaxID=89402 RepID=A0A5C6QBU3_9GAMM|nr:alginate export family protein [Colwellia hornerae]TWX52991.1 hypothetical protein ESZ28_10410 [Colwellia hornerae]TWX59254.1 hypothetical protein ESZ26_09790 [Colwellia hornerae]TWX66140.1 hypothetical protein ESZ27_10935 [Colwellia hornerae]